MSGKWTPGPWRATGNYWQYDPSDPDADYWTTVRNEDEETMATVTRELLDSALADARLIAAAPEMYRLLYWTVHGTQPDTHEPPTHPELRALLRRIDGENDT